MAMSTEQRVGFFFLLTLILLGGMIELVEDWHPFAVQHPYVAYFNSAVGIKVGDPVRMAGVEVGKVKAISIDGSRVRIDFEVSGDTQIKADSVIQVRQTNLLGGQFLGITFGSADSELLAPGSTVLTKETTNVDELITSLNRNQERVLSKLADFIEETRGPLTRVSQHLETIVGKVSNGEGTLGRMVNDPALYNDLTAAVGRLNSVLKKIEDGQGTMGRLVQDPALYDELTSVAGNLRGVSQRLAAGEGTIGKLLADDQAYNDLVSVLGNAREISDRLKNGEGTMGKMLVDDTLYNDASAALARLHSIAAKIDDGKGTVGRLVNEDDLYKEAKTTIHKVEKTMDSMGDTGPLSTLGIVIGTLF